MAAFDQAKKDIVMEYESILLGKRKQFSSYYFSGYPERDSDIALEAFRYLFDKILCWDIPTLKRNLSLKLLKAYKLDKYLMTKVIFKYQPNHKPRLVDGELTEPDIDELISMVYKDSYKIDIRGNTIKTYEDVLNGKIAKFPKGFFGGGWLGKTKACVCLQHALNLMQSFSTVEDMYRLFSDKNIYSVLKRWKLDLICKSLYLTPIDYLHNALPDSMKDEQLYMQYGDIYRNFLRISGRKY